MCHAIVTHLLKEQLLTNYDLNLEMRFLISLVCCLDNLYLTSRGREGQWVEKIGVTVLPPPGDVAVTNFYLDVSLSLLTSPPLITQEESSPMSQVLVTNPYQAATTHCHRCSNLSQAAIEHHHKLSQHTVTLLPCPSRHVERPICPPFLLINEIEKTLNLPFSFTLGFHFYSYNGPLTRSIVRPITCHFDWVSYSKVLQRFVNKSMGV